jgi:small subunit ribosomal protein S3
MSTIKHFINDALRDSEIDEFLQKELERAGYGGVEITSTPLGTRVIISAMRLGIIIGRRGTAIRDLAKKIEEKFGLTNPQIAVAEIEVPELNPRIMASRIVDGLQRGIHFRRSGFWSLNRIMGAGALGAEIIISGKLRTRRHRYEKYRAGYIPSSGEPAIKNVKTAIRHVKLRPGILGVKVKIVPPDAEFPDRIKLTFPHLEVKETDNDDSIGKTVVGEE